MYFAVCLLSVYVWYAAVDTFENTDNVTNGMLSTLVFILFY